jgi:transposase-like protein
MIRRQQIEQNFQAAQANVLELTRSHDHILTWLADQGLISRMKRCVTENCQGIMSWKRDTSRPDGYIFNCHVCDAKSSIRRNTLFEGSHLSLMELTRIYFHYFLEKVSIKRCSRELHLTQKTVGKLYAKIRSAISSYVTEDLQGDTLLGELPQDSENMDEQDQYPVVEIDESLFSHFTEQGVRTQVWVLGMYDRGSDHCRMFVVPDRTSETLTNLILENVAPDTVIYTDGWAGYNNLRNLGYVHRVVIHARGFGRGLDTTNNIESCWSQIKRLTDYYKGIQGRGPQSMQQIQDRINHGVWLRYVGNSDALDALIQVINSQFIRQ